jgi:hypothetical protein
MSAGGHMTAMQSTIKHNDRRKSKNKPFKKYIAKYTKSKPLFSKKLSIQEKRKLLIRLENNRNIDNKQLVYKLIISLILTIIVISGILFIIKLTFF